MFKLTLMGPHKLVQSGEHFNDFNTLPYAVKSFYNLPFFLKARFTGQNLKMVILNIYFLGCINSLYHNNFFLKRKSIRSDSSISFSGVES